MSVDPTTGTPPRPKPSTRFSARDLLDTAIFAVILIVVTYATGLLGIVSPLVWLLVVPLQVVASGIPVMLFLTRVRHTGMLTLFAGVVALFYLLGGNTLLGTAWIIVLGLVAEVILRSGRYRSRWAAIWAYTVFALSFFTPFLPLLVDRDSYLADSTWTQMGSDYVNAADALLTLPVLGIVALVIVITGFLGGLLGSALLRKHFVRAGLA